MNNPTDANEWAFLRRKVDGGGATPGDVARMNELQRRMIQTAVAAAMRSPEIVALRQQAAQRQAQAQQRRESAAQVAIRNEILRKAQRR